MAAKKKKKRKIEVWKNVGKSISVKDEIFSVQEILEFVKKNTPAGTKKKDIKLKFDYDEEPYYYDEILTSCKMSVAIREMVEVEW